MATRDELRSEADRLHEDVIHTEKSLFSASRGWSAAHVGLGVLATIAGAVAGASGLSDASSLTVVAGVVAAIASGLLTFLHPADAAKRYLDPGRKFAALRGDLRRFSLLDVQDGDPVQLRKRIEQFAARKAELDVGAPAIPRWAFWLAKRSIAKGEPAYRADGEK